MCEDPIADEFVTLVVAFADDADAETARETVESLAAERGGAVDRDLRFADLAVSLPEAAVADLCAVDGLARVETDATLDLSPSGAEE
jgi:hypothetical protein